MLHKPKPTIVDFTQVFGDQAFTLIRQHVEEVRRIWDWPGIPYHDTDEAMRFNRWHFNNLPLLTSHHHAPEMLRLVSDLAGMPLKPSYNFLSMYGPDGVCPLHSDRPQCQYTLDVCIDQDAIWPIYIEEVAHRLAVGDALFYSGTGQPHYRKPMSEDSKATFCNLAFFHFVPVTWQGGLS